MDTKFVGRPAGAEERENARIEAAAVHPEKTSRRSRVHDVIDNIKFFIDRAHANNEPLALTVERDVEDPTGNELPILHAAMNEKGIVMKDTYGVQSTESQVLKDDKTAQALVDAYYSKKSYDGLFGGIEQRKLQAASTRDQVPSNTSANPSLETPLKDAKRAALYSFGIEDVYADVITTDASDIDELTFNNDDTTLFEMYLRKELGDIKTVEVTVAESTNKMVEMALGVRWGDKFAKNAVRMSVIDRWRDQCVIGARNALRNMGLYKLANEGTPATKSKSGKTRGNLFAMGFEFGDAYPSNMLVMDLDTIATWMVPGATTNLADTIVSDDLPLNLLTMPSPNTNLGVTKNNVWEANTTNKILNYVRDLGINLYVDSTSFQYEVTYDGSNKSYLGTLTFEFCPVLIDRNARIIWSIA